MSGPSLRPWRDRVVATARAMNDLGLVRGSSGNVSARVGEKILITPSGVPYCSMRGQQVMTMTIEGHVLSGSGVPSSEWRMHAAIYRARPDVRAIVHTHSPYATAASFQQSFPVAPDEARLLFGEEVPVSRPAPPGTWELAEAVTEALAAGRGALIARHGAVAVGQTLGMALLHAEKIEEVAKLSLLLAIHEGRGG
ncbi:TPA: class II aldolase family protein [Candidatus Acetothermia bacterium]|nr:class II aldolase family protein [Candidatus Acetothermia bacterium]